MTFLKEEEVFPTVPDSDTSKIVEDSSELNVSATALKEESKEESTDMVADRKRKLSDKPEEKKVSIIWSSY